MTDGAHPTKASRAEWRMVVLITAAIALLTAAVHVLGHRSVGDAWQVVLGGFRVVVAIGTAVSLWLAGAVLVGHALRPAQRSERRGALIWGTTALALAAAYTWALASWWLAPAS